MRPLTLAALLTVGFPLVGFLIFTGLFLERARWEEAAAPDWVGGLICGGLFLLLATPVPFCFTIYYFLKGKDGKVG